MWSIGKTRLATTEKINNRVTNCFMPWPSALRLRSPWTSSSPTSPMIAPEAPTVLTKSFGLGVRCLQPMLAPAPAIPHSR